MGLSHSASHIVLGPDISLSGAGSEPRDSSVSGSYHGTSLRGGAALTDQNHGDFFQVGYEILDLLSIAFVICDPASRLMQANQTARRILRVSDGLRMDSSGRMSTSKPTSPALPEVVRELTDTRRAAMSKTTHITIAVPRPSGRRPLIVCVLNPAFLGDYSGSLVPGVPMVFWEHEEGCGEQQVYLQRVWGLTPAECRFANLLMEGLSLVDCCGRLGICRATGAFHLKNLFRKTGTRRQIELLSLLFREIGPRSVGQRKLKAVVGYSPRMESNGAAR